MREKLDALKIQNDRVERAIDHMTDILLLIRTEHQPERRELLWEIYGRARLRMNTESARLNEMIEQIRVEQKERSIMRTRLVSVTVILIVALLLVSGFAVAVAQEDVLSTNTPQAVEATEVPAATEAPPVVVNIEQQPNTGGLGSTEIILIVSMGMNVVLILVIVRDKNNNKELVPPSVVFAFFGMVKDLANRTASTLDDTLVGSFEDIARRLLNAPPPAPTSTVPTIPDPDPFKQQYPADGQPGQVG